MKLLILLWLQFALAATAADWHSDDGRFSLQIPDGPNWRRLAPHPPVQLSIKRADKTAEIIYAQFPPQTNKTTLDLDFVNGFDKGFWPKGKSHKATGEFTELKGKYIYRTTGDMTIKDVIYKKTAIVWVENDQVALLSLMQRETDPLSDPDIKACLDSLKFTAPPATTPPAPDRSPPAKAPADSHP
ncbi:MAG TPA: hypothetical protein VHB20_00775 [Verrucomicrobiae bacterium]|jgi:hypothetical protein|nr:hypothetical protein [Verrucomicrobiae bacterium]